MDRKRILEDGERAEEILRESENSVRLIVDGIAGLVAIMTPEGEVEFVNNFLPKPRSLYCVFCRNTNWSVSVELDSSELMFG